MARRPNGPRKRKRPQEPAKPPETPASSASLLARTDVLAAIFLGGGVILIAVVAILLSRGGGSDTPAPAAGSATSVAYTPGPTFSPATDDDRAVRELARLTIDVLPAGQWPSLYDSFTADFQQRCPRGQFDKGGADAATALGSDLALLRFVRLEGVTITADSATGVVIGVLQGSSEYAVQAAFRKVDGAWKLAPADGTTACEAFQRLSG